MIVATVSLLSFQGSRLEWLAYGTFQCVTIPPSEVSYGSIGALKKHHECPLCGVCGEGKIADTMFPRTLMCFSCLLLVADTTVDFNRVINRRVIIL
jgi:hypothetical protein